MIGKRSRLWIYIDILRTVSKGTQKPTRIMYRTNLSWKPLMSALDSLVEQGLISRSENGSRATYEITQKGRSVLKYFKEAMELIEIR